MPKVHYRLRQTSYGAHVGLCSIEHGDAHRFTSRADDVTCGICLRMLTSHGEPAGAEEWTPPPPRLVERKKTDARVGAWVAASVAGTKPARWGSAHAALESMWVSQRSRSPVSAVDPTPSIRGTGGSAAPVPAAVRLITETVDVERALQLVSQHVSEDADQEWADPHTLRRMMEYKVVGAPMGMGRRSPPLPTYQVAEELERMAGVPVTAREVTRLYTLLSRALTVELAAREIIPWPQEGHPIWRRVARRHAELTGVER